MTTCCTRTHFVSGILLVALVAIVASLLHSIPVWPFTIGTAHPIESVLIAIVLGIVIGNVFKLPDHLLPGIKFCIQRLLPIAIILLGARLNFHAVAGTSLKALIINITCVIVAFSLTIWLCRRVKINSKLGILTAIGTAICGSAAIVVAAPVIEASETDISISITTINLFGLLAIFIFPIIGHHFHMNSTHFGVWAGTSIQAVPQVIAAGFAFGPHAGAIATITKLIRVLLLGPMIAVLSIWHHRQAKNNTSHPRFKWTTFVPPFILGFLAVITLNSLGWLPTFTIAHWQIPTTHWLTQISSFLVTMVLAGIGLKVNLKHMLKVGLKPLSMGFVAALILACTSITLIHYL